MCFQSKIIEPVASFPANSKLEIIELDSIAKAPLAVCKATTHGPSACNKHYAIEFSSASASLSAKLGTAAYCSTSSATNMQAILLLVILIIANNLFALANESNGYPQSAFQCFASSAIESQKDGKIICPPGSNNFCIKRL